MIFIDCFTLIYSFVPRLKIFTLFFVFFITLSSPMFSYYSGNLLIQPYQKTPSFSKDNVVTGTYKSTVNNLKISLFALFSIMYVLCLICSLCFTPFCFYSFLFYTFLFYTPTAWVTLSAGGML